MEMPVKEQVDCLVRLQSMENRTRELVRQIEAAEAQLGDLDRAMQDERKEYEARATALAEIQKRYRMFESDLEVNEARIEKSQETIRTVTTNKEYQVLQREIDDNRKINEGIQESMLTLLDEIESAESEVAIWETRLATLKEESDGKKAELDEQFTSERQQMEALEEEKRELRAEMPEKLVDTFDKALHGGAGLGVAAVKANICQGCFMSVPPQFGIELQRFNDIGRCPRCKRLVYWSQDDE